MSSVAAQQVQYRNEYIHGFERMASIVRQTCTTEVQIKGNQAVFLVADSGGATTVSRGPNGEIPARADNNTQFVCDLTEEHDLVRKTNYNIFASQGDQVQIMQKTSMGVLNRKMDQQIISQLNIASQTAGAAGPATVGLFAKAMATLGNNQVMYDGAISALISPAALGFLQQIPAFANAEWVNVKPLAGIHTSDADGQGYYRWMNMHLYVHSELPGAGTSSETNFVYHRNAIGHAANVAGADFKTGYDEEQDYSFARASCFMGAKLLQPQGVVKVLVNATAL